MCQISIRLPIKDEKRMDKAVQKGHFQNQSDLIRDAIRSKLIEVEAKAIER